MARKPKYNLNLVFEYALPVVSELGYRGCNMNTLMTKTGFNRRAFYSEFGDKQRFFESLTKFYIDTKLLPLFSHFDAAKPAKSQVYDFLIAYQQTIAQHGCILVTMLNELSRESDVIQDLARHFYDQLSLEFIAVLERAYADSNTDRAGDIERNALQLTFFTQAFAVTQHLKQGDEDINTLLNYLFDESSELA